MNKHWHRLWISVLGRWRPEMQEGRTSSYKGYLGELGHSTKNVLVEYLRHWNIYDRPSQPDGK